MSQHHADSYDLDRALEAMRRTVDQFSNSPTDEQSALRQDFRHLLEMSEKLESGRVDIVVFGEINAGKSSLINALLGAAIAAADVRGGWTRETSGYGWDSLSYRVPGFASSQVMLVDTPGINEVDGAERHRIAQEAARRADLILFVTDSDLNEVEFAALTELSASNKPILLAFNKIDLYTREQRTRLREVLAERLDQIIAAENIVETTADPREVEVVTVLLDGSEETVWRKPKPKIEELKVRILEILDKEGKALIALNAALYAADASDKLNSTRIRLRSTRASAAIWQFAVAKGIAVAVNPLPVLDIAGGAAVDVTMVMTLARIYGIEMTRRRAGELFASIVKSAGLVAIIEYATHIAANLIVVLTFGIGKVATALPQAAAGAYGSYIVGNAAQYYFEHGGSWGDRGPKAVVQEILEKAQQESVLQMLKERIARQIEANRHAVTASEA